MRGKGGLNMYCIEQGIEEHEREGRPEHVQYRTGNRGAREGRGGQNMHCIEQGIEEHGREGRPEHVQYRAGNRGAREGREARTCTV